MDEVNRITRSYWAGPIGYGFGFVLSFFSTPTCLSVNLALALFFAFTGISAKDLGDKLRRREG